VQPSVSCPGIQQYCGETEERDDDVGKEDVEEDLKELELDEDREEERELLDEDRDDDDDAGGGVVVGGGGGLTGGGGVEELCVLELED
jgi:hypothetical protein